MYRFFCACFFLVSLHSHAINEHPDSLEITERATFLITDAKQQLDETCNVFHLNRLNILHSQFTYSSFDYYLPGDHFFWGSVKHELGSEYWSWGCTDTAIRLFDEAKRHATLSQNEILIEEVRLLPDSLLPPGQINDELCRRVRRPDCPN